MATHQLDTLGLKCPQPILKIAIQAKSIADGEAWCQRTGKILLVCADEGGGKFKAQIQF